MAPAASKRTGQNSMASSGLTKVIIGVRFADGIEVCDDQPAQTTQVAA